MEEVRVSTSLFAMVLFPATAADPEPANSGGKAEVHNSPGHLVDEGKKINSCRFPEAQCFTTVSLGQEDVV